MCPEVTEGATAKKCLVIKRRDVEQGIKRERTSLDVP